MTDQPIPTIAGVIENYMTAQDLSFRALADRLTVVLQQREHEPRSISHAAIAFWHSGQYRPGAPLFEYVRDHAQDEHLRQFATDLLAALLNGNNSLPE